MGLRLAGGIWGGGQLPLGFLQQISRYPYLLYLLLHLVIFILLGSKVKYSGTHIFLIFKKKTCVCPIYSAKNLARGAGLWVRKKNMCNIWRMKTSVVLVLPKKGWEGSALREGVPLSSPIPPLPVTTLPSTDRLSFVQLCFLSGFCS